MFQIYYVDGLVKIKIIVLFLETSTIFDGFKNETNIVI